MSDCYIIMLSCRLDDVVVGVAETELDAIERQSATIHGAYTMDDAIERWSRKTNRHAVDIVGTYILHIDDQGSVFRQVNYIDLDDWAMSDRDILIRIDNIADYIKSACDCPMIDANKRDEIDELANDLADAVASMHREFTKREKGGEE